MQNSSKATHVEPPADDEYNPYYVKYISLVTETDIIGVLEDQCYEIEKTYGTLPEERGTYSYAADKWTIKESLSHLIDAERIFAYRVLRISRGDATPIEGFEQDGYIENSYANERSFADLKEELIECRQANLRQFRNLKHSDWKRLGTASNSPVSVRALAYIMAGHIRHHFAIHRERYV